jgi:hypothetical protein
MVLLTLAALGLAAPQCENEFKLAPLSIDSCSFLGNATSYLPDPQVYAAYRARAPLWRDTVEEADQKIARLQFPPSCTDGETMWHLHQLASHGFGANLMGFARLAGIHWDAGKSVTITRFPYRFNPTGECGSGWSCWLSPLTNCSLREIPLQRVTWRGDRWADVDMTRECSAPHGRFDVESGTCICESGWVAAGRECRRRADMEEWDIRTAIERPSDQVPAEQFFRDVPGHVQYVTTERASRLVYGLMWWLGHRAWYLLKDSPKRPELDAFVQRAGLTGGSCLAIHVRRGDSCNDKTNPQKTCPSISAYVDSALNMQRKYGPYDHVYVASDDELVVQEVQRSLQGVVYQPIDRRVFHQGASPEHQLGVDDNHALESAQQVQEFMNDMWAMGSCQAFVGTFTSSISQLAYTMQVMRSGHYVPFTSLDEAFENKWFMDYMGLKGEAEAEREAERFWASHGFKWTGNGWESTHER